MLQLIRDRAQGIVVWAIVGLIIVTFALFGLGSYMSGTSNTVVATVNGTEVTQTDYYRAYRNYQDNLQRMLGERYNPDMFPAQQVKQTVVDGLVTRTLLDQALSDSGFTASPEQISDQITSIPAFYGENETFSRTRYEELLRQQGLSSEAFEADVAKDLVNQQLSQGITGTEFVTRAEALQQLRLKGQQRDVGYLTVAAQSFHDGIEISEEEIQQYFDANAARYMDPEKVKLAYVVLDIEDLATQFDVTDKAVLEAYEQSLASYTTSAEERRARHILIKVDDTTDDASALQQANTLREKVVAGESFQDLAREHSQDPGSASQGGDLGFFARGVMDPSFEDAAFSLKPGVVSEPVRSRYGYHLIVVDEVKPPKITPFEEVRDRIRKELQILQAEQRFYEDSEKLYNLAYEHPDSLEPAASELGLTVQHSDWVQRSGGTGMFANGELVNAAFSDDVLREGRNSELVKLSETKLVVVRLDDHEEAKQKPLADVKSAIEETLRVKKVAEKTQQAAQDARTRLASGEDPEGLARDVSEATWTRVGFIDRNAADSKLSTDLRQLAFTLPLREGGSGTYEITQRPNGDTVVVGVFGVKQKEDVTDDEISREQKRLASSFGSTQFNHYVQNLREQADITINLPEDDTF